MNKFLKWGCLGSIGIVFLLIIIGATASNKTSDTKVNQNQENTNKISDIKPSETNTTEEKLTPTTLDTKQFISEFDKNQLAAEEKYKGKTVKLSAFIKNISEDILGNPFLSLQPTSDKYYFGTSIQCVFKDKSELTHVENGQKIIVVGNVESQDLGIIRIKDCSITD